MLSSAFLSIRSPVCMCENMCGMEVCVYVVSEVFVCVSICACEIVSWELGWGLWGILVDTLIHSHNYIPIIEFWENENEQQQ